MNSNRGKKGKTWIRNNVDPRYRGILRTCFGFLPAGMFAVFLVSCATVHEHADGETEPRFSPEQDAYSYYPLAVGNKWKYKGVMLGNIEETSVTITGKDGKIFLDSNGGKFVVDEAGLRDSRRYLLKNPVVRGMKWTSVTAKNIVEHFEILEDDDIVELPAGRFKTCITVQGIYRIDHSREYVTRWSFARNVGIVRIETFMRVSGSSVIPQGTMELVSYHIENRK